jgi:hypothetical protein
MITPSELKRIKAATNLARTNLFFERSGLNKGMRGVESNLWSDDEKCHAKGVFEMLRMEMTLSSITLDTPAIRKAVIAALEKNDVSFFVWVGRILSTNGLQAKLNRNKLPNFLLDHWDRAASGLPELFYLTKKGVTDVCEAALGNIYTEDAISKQCQRLGLLSFSGRKIRVTREKMAAHTHPRLVFQRPDGTRFFWPS